MGRGSPRRGSRNIDKRQKGKKGEKGNDINRAHKNPQPQFPLWKSIQHIYETHEILRSMIFSTVSCLESDNDVSTSNRKHRLNCCHNGKYTIPAFKPVPPELMNTFTSKELERAQRGYNGLFSFTALGAGGVDKISWT